MLPIVRLQRRDSVRPVGARQRFADLPLRTEEAIILEAVTLPPSRHLPYEFELREAEGLQFIFRSELSVDLLVARMSDYEAWTSGVQHPAQPLLVYAEALDTLGHAIEFVAPEDASYAAILLNDNASAVDVAVEIRLSPPMVEACV
jgi:hypothetical protein